MAPEKAPVTVTLELEAGNASLMILGKMLGPTGVPPFAVKHRYDAATADRRGEIIPAVITVDARQRWTMRLETPPTASLIRAVLGRPGAPQPGHKPVGAISRADLRRIAIRKLPDLDTGDVDVAMRIVAGTARSMGVRVEE
ncbi:uL11 family ribosomal protein [Nocardia sp. NPDC058176]|uniref:uL11 family ribosomal protein n=1 Tax=Nocardia sp. NPDC058176 TaxID=3346368 RepID=UPI0036D8D474